MIVVKVGGGKNINWKYISQDIKNIIKTEPVIIVHGAGDIRDDIAEKMGSPTKTITSPSGISSVYTDQTAMDIFLMVYPGLVNKKIVANLQSKGINAVGLSGVDGAMYRAKHKKHVLSKEGTKVKLITNNLTGRVERVNTHLLELLINSGYTPVIAPPALSYENKIVNTDNDWATAILASDMKIKKIVYLFEAPGLLEDFEDKDSLISSIPSDKIDDYMKYAQGRMKKKVLGVKKAIELGVQSIYWGDGRIKNPISSALAGNGTIISNTKKQ